MTRPRRQTSLPKRVVNLITTAQVLYLRDAVEQAAFDIVLSSGEDVIARLSSAGEEIFKIDLTNRVIYHCHDGREDRVYVCPAHKMFSLNLDEKVWLRLEAAIQSQYALGGQESQNNNLITRHEVTVLFNAIRAMAFSIERNPNNLDEHILKFDGRECIRINTANKNIFLIGLSQRSELVYTFNEDPEGWFWSGTDRQLWSEITAALSFFEKTMHRVRMQDYRALFGAQMQKTIAALAQAMEEAEADARMLEKVDKTNSGRNLHPDVARLVQKDLDESEERANSEEQDG